MRKLFLSLLPCLLTACHFSSGVLSQEQFTRLYADTLSKRFPAAHFTYIDAHKLTSKSGDKELFHYTDNAYQAYLQDPDSVGSVLHTYAESAADVYAMGENNKVEDLVPIIKPLDYVRELREVPKDFNAKKHYDPVYEPYNDSLVICYALDSKNNIAYITTDQLKTLGIPRDSLRSIATRNLTRILSGQIRIQGDSGVYMLVAGGNYEASLILVSDFWENPVLQVKGDFVIGIPSRDVVLITGSKDEPNVKKIKEYVRKAYDQSTYAVSSAIYKWDGKRFSPYE